MKKCEVCQDMEATHKLDKDVDVCEWCFDEAKDE
jgi:hypothetical protein